MAFPGSVESVGSSLSATMRPPDGATEPRSTSIDHAWTTMTNAQEGIGHHMARLRLGWPRQAPRRGRRTDQGGGPGHSGEAAGPARSIWSLEATTPRSRTAWSGGSPATPGPWRTMRRVTPSSDAGGSAWVTRRSCPEPSPAPDGTTRTRTRPGPPPSSVHSPDGATPSAPLPDRWPSSGTAGRTDWKTVVGSDRSALDALGPASARLKARTRRLLDSLWPQVEIVAGALVEGRELCGEEVAYLLRDFRPPRRLTRPAPCLVPDFPAAMVLSESR